VKVAKESDSIAVELSSKPSDGYFKALKLEPMRLDSQRIETRKPDCTRRSAFDELPT
jgi:hypothetical protein